MKIVIEVSDTLMEYIVKGRDLSEEQNDEMAYAIANGTSLPEHHGRLIDADYLREDFKASKKISFAERMDISCIVDHSPTIIEADKEEERW